MVLSTLSASLLRRRLFKIRFSDQPGNEELAETARRELLDNGIPESLHTYFMVEGQTKNIAYLTEKEEIRAKLKNGQVINISEISDMPSIQGLSKIVHKYYICWAKNVSLRP